MLGEGTIFFGVLAGRGPEHVVRNRLESFAQFAGNENFSSPLGPTPIDRQPTAGEGCKCGELLHALEAVQRTHFRHIITGDESWFCIKYQHVSQRSVSRDEMPQKVGVAIGTAKFMLTNI
jgi:hypothetical protein